MYTFSRNQEKTVARIQIASLMAITLVLLVLSTTNPISVYAQTDVMLTWEGPNSATIGDTLQLRIMVNASVPLGAYDLKISLDDTLVVRIVDLLPGTSPDFGAPMAFSIVEDGQSILLNDFQSTTLDGPTGAIHIATLVLECHAEGQTGGTLTEVDFFGTGGEELNRDWNRFEISVVVGMLGDVNDNGVLDIGDAMLISQHLSGYRPWMGDVPKFFALCDINDNGECDIGDAMLISQILAELVDPPQ